MSRRVSSKLKAWRRLSPSVSTSSKICCQSKTLKRYTATASSHLTSLLLPQIFDLKLDWGQYKIDYTSDGNHLLLGGSKGHLAVMNWKEKKLATEIQVKESIRDVQFLHDSKMFAVREQNRPPSTHLTLPLSSPLCRSLRRSTCTYTTTKALSFTS